MPIKVKISSLKEDRVSRSRERAVNSCQEGKGKENRFTPGYRMKSVTEYQDVRKILPGLSNFTHLPEYYPQSLKKVLNLWM
jgi:hypothetical protein